MNLFFFFWCIIDALIDGEKSEKSEINYTKSDLFAMNFYIIIH